MAESTLYKNDAHSYRIKLEPRLDEPPALVSCRWFRWARSSLR